MVKFVPTKASLGARTKDGLMGGVVGGLTVGIGTRMLGAPVGTALGAIIGGAMLPEETGRIVAVNGIMDAVTTMVIGAGQ